MVRRWLMVRGDTIENAVEWDGDLQTWAPPEGVEMIAADDVPGADIGWTRVAGIWGPPAPPVDE